MFNSATPWTAACQAFLFLTISQGLPKFMFIRSVMPSSYLILWLLFFCPWSFPPSGTSPMSHLCASDDQNTSASASASVLPVNIQGWSPSRLTGLKKKKKRLTGLITLLSKGLSGVFSSTTVQRHQFFGVLPSLQSSSHVTTWKTKALTIQTFVCRVISLLFNTLSRFVIAFLPISNHLLISLLQSPSTVILEP